MTEKMFHYTACGLGNVYLRNGFTEVETEYGKAVSIHNREELHNQIGLYLVNHKPKLEGEDIRFLRIELDLSQAHLARILGVGDTSIRGWENDRQEITRPAERLLRTLYREHVCGDGTVRELIERVSELNRDQYVQNLELEERDGHWRAAA